VVPFYRNGQLFGVIDIDSPQASRFDESDQLGIEYLVKLLENKLGEEHF
jgi:GAF domain-containing protein